MAKRIDVSAPQNNFFDAEQVQKEDLDLEQNYNQQINSAIINNHFGSGVLLASVVPHILWDSEILSETQAGLEVAGNFDGTGLQVTEQPSDSTQGNQLQVELSGSSVVGRYSIKVALIGVDFEGNTFVERLIFFRNEKQVTRRHFCRVLCFFTNDFKGNNNCSRTLGGQLTIKEADSLEFSRDPVMVAQDVYPDIFWRDFKKADNSLSLATILQTGMGSEYTYDSLNINTSGKPNKTLGAGDITSQVGQKFLATSDNIQKITFLLGVTVDNTAAEEDKYDWSGDLVLSLYQLQESVSCPSDIVPDLAIEFDPSNQPVIQLSFSQATLADYGYVLTDVLQPIDFVLNATSIASPGKIKEGKYYAATLKRSGAAGTGEIALGVGVHSVEDSRETLYAGGVWVDVPDEDLWFQIWTDAVKVADGQGYDFGVGVLVPKVTVDEETGGNLDAGNVYAGYSLTNTGEGTLNVGIVQSILDTFQTVQDQRSGTNVDSEKQYKPTVVLQTQSQVSVLKQTTDPLIIGSIKDVNPKMNSVLTKTQSLVGMARGDQFCVVAPDADLLSLNLIGSTLIPNTSQSGLKYRIVQMTSCVDGYGDINGDGVIDQSDVIAIAGLVGESLSYESTQQKILDGYFTTLEILRADVNGDGYVSEDDVDLLSQYVAKEINSFPAGTSFTHLCLEVQSHFGRDDGYFDCVDGYTRLDGGLGLNVVPTDTLDASELLYDGYLVDPMLQLDPAFSVVPFVSVEYQIVPRSYWEPWLLLASSKARLVQAAFTEQDSSEEFLCSSTTEVCANRFTEATEYDPGQVDTLMPGDLYVLGQIKNRDGSWFKQDVEVGTIELRLPETPFTEAAINVFEKLVADEGEGKTVAGYPAMRYADCSTVQPEDLSLGKVKFSVAVQAFYPQLDGYDASLDGYVVILDDIIGVYMDQTTGILQMTLKDLAEDEIYQTLVTKLIITVYLKKAGWNNTHLVVEPGQVAGLIST